MSQRPQPTEAEVRQAALVAARLGGCSCQPTITVTTTDGISRADIAHDDGCAHVWMQRGRDA